MGEKLVRVLLAAVMVFSMTACGGGQEPSAGPAAESAVAEEAADGTDEAAVGEQTGEETGEEGDQRVLRLP